MLAQAKRMESEAKGMIAEAARMKKQAQGLNPAVNLSDYTVADPVVTTAPRKGRPPKAKVATADAVQ
jgi:hypothetical protein